jgi:hypothetical protein
MSKVRMRKKAACRRPFSLSGGFPSVRFRLRHQETGSTCNENLIPHPVRLDLPVGQERIVGRPLQGTATRIQTTLHTYDARQALQDGLRSIQGLQAISKTELFLIRSANIVRKIP